MIKFSHTAFALPVAFTSMIVAARGLPTLRMFLLILAAMVSARTAAMTFNRIADLKYDRLNPRTKDRPLPAGLLTVRFAAVLTAISSAIFIVVCSFINKPAFALSPVALAIILPYSYTKRFTSFSHLLLGLCLAIAPVGAWIAVTGRFEWIPLLLAGPVILWVAGFDTIYSILDCDFDRQHGLYSIVAKWGIEAGFIFVRFCHAATIVLLILFGLAVGLGLLYFAGIAVIGILLFYENIVAVRFRTDIKHINRAFFHANSIVSVVLLIFTSLDIFL